MRTNTKRYYVEQIYSNDTKLSKTKLFKMKIAELENLFNNLNSSKLLSGLLMIIMNIGGKYISIDLPQSLDIIFSNLWMRLLIIFSICFAATRDIKISILLLLIYILVFKFLLKENSKSYLLNKTKVKVSNEQYRNAIEIIKKYKNQ